MGFQTGHLSRMVKQRLSVKFSLLLLALSAEIKKYFHHKTYLVACIKSKLFNSSGKYKANCIKLVTQNVKKLLRLEKKYKNFIFVPSALI